MQQNQPLEKTNRSVIPYLFLFLTVIIGLTYYRIYIRHDYYVVPLEETMSDEMTEDL